MKNFKREPVKTVRDGMKSDYKDREPCYICGSTDQIELHHLYCVSELWNEWTKKNNIVVTSDSEVRERREEFMKAYEVELSNDNLYSLCKKHHTKLHQLFGKSYSSYFTPKVMTWLDKKRREFNECAKMANGADADKT